MTTYTDQDHAREIMRLRNRAAAASHRPNLFVLVDGPEDGEYTVMTLREAVDGEFLYSWEC